MLANVQSGAPSLQFFFLLEITLINSATISVQMLDMEPAVNVTRPRELSSGSCLLGDTEAAPPPADRRVGLSALNMGVCAQRGPPSRLPHLDPAWGQGSFRPGPLQCRPIKWDPEVNSLVALFLYPLALLFLLYKRGLVSRTQGNYVKLRGNEVRANMIISCTSDIFILHYHISEIYKQTKIYVDNQGFNAFGLLWNAMDSSYH